MQFFSKTFSLLLFVSVLACQPQTREANDAPDRRDTIAQKAEQPTESNTPDRQGQDTIAPKIKQTPEDETETPKRKRLPHEKITLKDIKGRFRHTEARQEPVPKDRRFYSGVAYNSGPEEKEHDLTYEDLEDLELPTAYGTDKGGYPKRWRYYAYSLRKIGEHYLVGIAHGGEFARNIDYFWADEKKLLKYCFSLHAGGDMGYMYGSFAYFDALGIEAHELMIMGNYPFFYKKYRISFLPALRTKTDTLIKQPADEKSDIYKQFDQILAQHGYTKEY